MPHIKKYVVTQSTEVRLNLDGLIHTGKAALKLARTRVQLKADAADGGPSWNSARIAEALEVGPATGSRVRQRFVERGMEEALNASHRTAPWRAAKS